MKMVEPISEIIPQTARIAITFIIQAYLYVNSFSYPHHHLMYIQRHSEIAVLIQQSDAVLPCKYCRHFLVHGNEKVIMPNGTHTGLGAVQMGICCESGKGNWSKCPWGPPYHIPISFLWPCHSCDLNPSSSCHVAALTLCPTAIAPG